MRCLTLAEELRTREIKTVFICRSLPGNINDYVKDRGFALTELSAGNSDLAGTSARPTHEQWLGVEPAVDAAETARAIAALEGVHWLIVDHYGLSRPWYEVMRPHVGRILAIDDLADRKLECDLLLNQNLLAYRDDPYTDLLPSRCRKLLGPQFALLRSEFEEWHAKTKVRQAKVNRVLVSYGGVDATNETAKALEAIGSLGIDNLEFTVVLGSANSHADSLSKSVKDLNQVTIYRNVDHMAELIAQADLALGAGGTTTWERAYLGLPAIITTVAANQVPSARAMAEAGAAVYLGTSEEVTNVQVASAIREILDDPPRISQMSRKAAALFGEDSRPGVKKVADAMFNRQPESDRAADEPGCHEPS
jgi:UDP-2,4-diacetamido-2,4,6-trideoxy-beta-L-altropyranose hydrolase